MLSRPRKQKTDLGVKGDALSFAENVRIRSRKTSQHRKKWTGKYEFKQARKSTFHACEYASKIPRTAENILHYLAYEASIISSSWQNMWERYAVQRLTCNRHLATNLVKFLLANNAANGNDCGSERSEGSLLSHTQTSNFRSGVALHGGRSIQSRLRQTTNKAASLGRANVALGPAESRGEAHSSSGEGVGSHQARKDKH
jgi:hypothetical protein